MISLDRLLDGLSVTVDTVVFTERRGQPSSDRARGVHLTVHILAAGVAIFEMVGGAVIRVEPTSITVLPARSRPRANGDPTARGGVRRNGPTEAEKAAGSKDLMSASGRLRASYLGSVALFDQLREPLVEPLRKGDPLGRSFRELLEEIAAQRPGRRAMMEAVLQRSLILLLRRCCGGAGGVTWMAAMEDPGISRAVSAMRDQPEHAFTLQGLAEVAGMSRSVFAMRFSESLARPPMEFLKEVRLDRAAELLTRTDLPVKAIAARVGYSSRSSFTRAFLATHHVGPSAFRLDERDASAAGTRSSRSKHGKDRRKRERRRSDARRGSRRLRSR
jgi:AraC family transcriptional regulator, activator of mtrCDE